MRTIAVTGGAGFIGRHAGPLLERAGFTVVRLSRRILPDVQHIDSYGDVDYGDFLIHLAEESRRDIVNRDGEAAVQLSTENLRRLVRRFKSRILYASSSAVYGDGYEEPCDVATPPIVTDLYSRAKLFNENLVLDAGGIVARFSNLFGGGMSAGNVLSDITRQIPGRGPLYVRDDTPIRDFLPVSDAAAAIVELVQGEHSGIMNIGSGVGLSIREVASILLSAANEANRVVVASHSSAQRSVNVLDISETCKRLNWSPTSELRGELARLVAA